MSTLKEFKKIIGTQAYSTYLDMLEEIGPDARTHRISVVIAAMLRHALSKLPDESKPDTLGEALLVLDEDPSLEDYESEEHDKVFMLIDELCREAGMRNQRESAKGGAYSIARNAIAEYIAWYNMPWEDY